MQSEGALQTAELQRHELSLTMAHYLLSIGAVNLGGLRRYTFTGDRLIRELDGVR